MAQTFVQRSERAEKRTVSGIKAFVILIADVVPRQQPLLRLLVDSLQTVGGALALFPG